MENNKPNVHVSGISFVSLLTLIFITLKLIGVIEWSWLWVLSPIWIPIIFVLFLFGIGILIGIRKYYKGDNKKI